jgi:uncharacterized membrane protein YhaH (DUF805 family)
MRTLTRQHYFTTTLTVFTVLALLLHVGIGDTLGDCTEETCQQLSVLISHSLLFVIPALLLPTLALFYLSIRTLRDARKTREQHAHARWNNTHAAIVMVLLLLPLVSYYPSLLVERLATAVFEAIFL